MDPISYIVGRVGKKVNFGAADINLKKYAESCINFGQFVSERTETIKEADHIRIH
jgi:hypothetical protein